MQEKNVHSLEAPMLKIVCSYYPVFILSSVHSIQTPLYFNDNTLKCRFMQLIRFAKSRKI